MTSSNPQFQPPEVRTGRAGDEQDHGKFVCNGVVITASCLAPPPLQAARRSREPVLPLTICGDGASLRPGRARLGWFKVIGLFANGEAEIALVDES